MKELKDMNKEELRAWLDASTAVVNVSAHTQPAALVHFFREGSGKWYATEEVLWAHPEPGEPEPLMHEQFTETLARALRLSDDTRLRYSGMIAVCIDGPAGYPLMTKVGEP